MPEDKLKELDDPEFWKSVRNRRIFKQFVDGKTIDDICDNLHLRRSSVILSIQHPSMIARLEDFLNIKLFDLDLKRLESRYWAFNKLKTEFEIRLKDASADTIVKEFLRFLNSEEPERKLNPKLVNIFLKVVQKQRKEKSPEEIESGLEKKYGYQHLDEGNSRDKNIEDGNSDSSTAKGEEGRTETAADSELDRKEQVEDKQELGD